MSHYIFIDESGDPGKPWKTDTLNNIVPTGASLYYILSAVCLTTQKLFLLEHRFQEIKNDHSYTKEVKSNEISISLYEKLLNLINELEIPIYYRIINKTKYRGIFSVDGDKKLHNIFDEYNLVKVARFAVEKCKEKENEIIIDRTDRRLLDNNFENFNTYLKDRTNDDSEIKVMYVTHVNSEYVYAMQLSDIINGALRDHFTKRNLNLKKIINKKYLYKIY